MVDHSHHHHSKPSDGEDEQPGSPLSPPPASRTVPRLDSPRDPMMVLVAQESPAGDLSLAGGARTCSLDTPADSPLDHEVQLLFPLKASAQSDGLHPAGGLGQSSCSLLGPLTEGLDGSWDLQAKQPPLPWRALPQDHFQVGAVAGASGPDPLARSICLSVW